MNIANIVADDLATRLAAIVGRSNVITDRSAMEVYENEWRGRYRGRARLVVRPGSTEEIAAVVTLCALMNIAIVPQGGNTGLVEGQVPDQSGEQIVLSV